MVEHSPRCDLLRFIPTALRCSWIVGDDNPVGRGAPVSAHRAAHLCAVRTPPRVWTERSVLRPRYKVCARAGRERIEPGMPLEAGRHGVETSRDLDSIPCLRWPALLKGRRRLWRRVKVFVGECGCRMRITLPHRTCRLDMYFAHTTLSWISHSPTPTPALSPERYSEAPR